MNTGHTPTSSTRPARGPAPARSSGIRGGFVAVGALLLVAASFGVGRATATSSTSTPSTPPAVIAPTTSSPATPTTITITPSTEYRCRTGRPC